MRLRADRDDLTAETFAALMAPFCPFESRPVVAVAVSGGRDSLALTLLAHDWACSRGGRVFGLIVDHGLRAEAADEARIARETLRSQGIDSEVLNWTGPKPASGLQEAAREARYRLLFEACRARSILHLLVAHHADDQAETVAMRAGRGSGPDGLAGMAALVEHRHLRVLRPLLGVPRSKVTLFMKARGIGWSEDPSNADLRFERVRVRAEGQAIAPSDPGGTRRTERERIGGTNSRRSDFDDSHLADEYTAEYVGDEKLGARDVTHYRLTGKDGVDVSFSKVELWVDPDMNVLKRQEFSESGKLMRTAYYPQWEKLFSQSKNADVWYPKEIRFYDEIEKANPAVHDLFFQVFDKGSLTDEKGLETDFKKIGRAHV